MSLLQPLADLREDKELFPTLQRLQECLCAELEAAKGPALCYCGLMVGDIMPLELMDCERGNCGVAWVRPVQAFPSTVFPDPDVGDGSCESPLAMTIEVGVARCYPTARDRNGLDPQQFFEAARLYMSDLQAARRAIQCCLESERFDGSHSVDAWEPIPAEGGVSGGIWMVTVRPGA